MPDRLGDRTGIKQVRHHHRGAFIGQSMCVDGSDALCGSRDDCYSSFKTLCHVRIPFSLVET